MLFKVVLVCSNATLNSTFHMELGSRASTTMMWLITAFKVGEAKRRASCSHRSFLMRNE